MPDRPDVDRVHDARILRAIAHPVRNRILQEIAAVGPSRAADLARDLDIPANQASFHLRQLAKYGLVEEAPEQARDRRDRVWRAVAERGLTIDTGDLEATPGGQAAVAVFHRQAASWAHEIVDAAYSRTKEEGTRRTIADYTIRLTAEEAAELSAELDEVLSSWNRRNRGREGDRRTYLYHSMLLPHPGTPAPAPGADDAGDADNGPDRGNEDGT